MKPSNVLKTIRRFVRTSSFRLIILYAWLFYVSLLAVLANIYWRTIDKIDTKTYAHVYTEMDELMSVYKTDGKQALANLVQQKSQQSEENFYLYVDEIAGIHVDSSEAYPLLSNEIKGWKSFVASNNSGKRSGHLMQAQLISVDKGILAVGRDVQQREDLRLLILDAMISSLLIAAGFGTVGGVLMAHRMLRQIDVVTENAREIMAGDFSHRFPLSGAEDEFDRLREILNNMLADIERLMIGIRHVTHNIAHDLRSPLTRLKTRLELALEDKDEENRSQAIDHAIQETDQILRTFQALLSIAEIEAGRKISTLAEIDLSQLVEDIVDLYQPLVEDEGLKFTASIDSEVMGKVHRELLIQAISNLIDNAIKYNQQGGEVFLSLKRNMNYVVITITDTGIGIPSAAREKVTEPFTRLDPARNSPGNGLGLSLVKAIVKMHQGKLTLLNNPMFSDGNRGLMVEIILPV
ncbi:MAG: ATP-binding protein [Alphaproteobacteria bacterium]